MKVVLQLLELPVEHQIVILEVAISTLVTAGLQRREAPICTGVAVVGRHGPEIVSRGVVVEAGEAAVWRDTAICHGEDGQPLEEVAKMRTQKTVRGMGKKKGFA